MNYKNICLKVVQLCKHVGEFIRNESNQFSMDYIEYKGFNDLVSYVDKAAESRLIHELRNIFPEAGFIAEESGDFDSNFFDNDTFYWIIDPLDGTTNFIHGIPTFAISIALYKGSKGVLGVVYEINRDEMFASYLGAPLFLNDKIVAVSNRKTMAEGLIATGFPYYDFTLQTSYLQLLNEVMRNCQGIRRIGAAAVDLAYVACGRFEGFFEYNLKPWDLAAGAFLVQQAGGKVSGFWGDSTFLKTNHITATNGHIHSELLNKISENFKI